MSKSGKNFRCQQWQKIQPEYSVCVLEMQLGKRDKAVQSLGAHCNFQISVEIGILNCVEPGNYYMYILFPAQEVLAVRKTRFVATRGVTTPGAARAPRRRRRRGAPPRCREEDPLVVGAVPM